jgi:L-asparaginase
MQRFLFFLQALIELVGHDGLNPRDAKELSHANDPLPNITIIATGGTIAGATDSSARTTDYEAGALHIDAIAREIDNAWRNDAIVRYDQFMNVDSLNIDSSREISISQRVIEVANNPHIQGIVLLLGTDLLSELAVLLALTVTSHKPIVMTGAISPHTALSADGPGNILAAVRTAATKG